MEQSSISSTVLRLFYHLDDFQISATIITTFEGSTWLFWNILFYNCIQFSFFYTIKTLSLWKSHLLKVDYASAVRGFQNCFGFCAHAQLVPLQVLLPSVHSRALPFPNTPLSAAVWPPLCCHQPLAATTEAVKEPTSMWATSTLMPSNAFASFCQKFCSKALRFVRTLVEHLPSHFTVSKCKRTDLCFFDFILFSSGKCRTKKLYFFH